MDIIKENRFKYIFIGLICFIINSISIVKGQEQFQNIVDSLYKGEKHSLYSLACYLDNKDKIGNQTLSSASLEIIENFCLFTDEEIILNETLSKQQFTNFLNKKYDKIVFSKELNAYYITPIEKRSFNYQLREISSQNRSRPFGTSKFEIDMIIY